ncbi:hypothetical protein ElyMa_005014900 [Elysia marginata]|uniref:CCHC-type domain-containing protein n=1 Tax=Elysia marginata TaxID=1093978 RepID=A0AAV4J7H3_9GAST|nr:hypothetical protein ElyMa_005014900 [Elysia marginata]
MAFWAASQGAHPPDNVRGRPYSRYPNFPDRRFSRGPRSPSPDKKKAIVCFYCNKTGHTKKDCYKLAKDKFSSSVVCNCCGRPGHYKSQCPDLGKGRQSKNYYSNTAVADSYVPLSNDVQCALIGTSQYNRNGKLVFENATVNGISCNLLRDSGCDTIAVSRSLVPPASFTGRSLRVRTFCCRERSFPTAVVDLKSPYFSGGVEACVLDNPVADVILGNIKGIYN